MISIDGRGEDGLYRYAYAPGMFRKRPDRIKGIAGSLDSKKIVVVDGSIGAGPGIVRVMAESGAHTLFAGPDHVTVDLQLRKLIGSPLPVDGIALDQAEGELLYSVLEPVPYAVVVNPSRLMMTPGDGIGPQEAVSFAEAAAVAMRDAGRTGSIVLVTGIDHDSPAAAAVAFLDSEMRRLARDVAANGIRVNAVAPGYVAVNRRGNPVASRVAPLGHSSVHPVEVGKAAWVLVNDNLSGGVTGATLTVDRGASLSRVEL